MSVSGLCVNCNAPMRVGTLFCVSCGMKVGAANCSTCGASLTPGDQFCGGCGTATAVVSQTVTQPAALPVQPAPFQQPTWAPAPAQSKPQYIYGGFWRRFFALLIDSVVLSLVIAVLGTIGIERIAILGNLASQDQFPDYQQYYGYLYRMLIDSYIAQYILITICVAFGGTPGKLALGMRVQTLDSKVPGLWRAAVRTSSVYAMIPLYFLLDGNVAGLYVGLAIQLLSGLAMFANAERRTLADQLAGTVVVRS